MDTEAKIIIAFLFNRSGKQALKESELYLPLSMELGWFSTKEAQEFVAYAVAQGLLVKKGGTLTPNFPVDTITIPVGFAPKMKTFAKKKGEPTEESIVEHIASQISEKTGRDKKEVLEEITTIASEKNILPEVAALFVARTYDLPLEEWYDKVETSLFKGSTK
jgi:hypothetical protein